MLPRVECARWKYMLKCILDRSGFGWWMRNLGVIAQYESPSPRSIRTKVGVQITSQIVRRAISPRMLYVGVTKGSQRVYGLSTDGVTMPALSLHSRVNGAKGEQDAIDSHEIEHERNWDDGLRLYVQFERPLLRLEKLSLNFSAGVQT